MFPHVFKHIQKGRRCLLKMLKYSMTIGFPYWWSWRRHSMLNSSNVFSSEYASFTASHISNIIAYKGKFSPISFVMELRSHDITWLYLSSMAKRQILPFPARLLWEVIIFSFPIYKDQNRSRSLTGSSDCSVCD